MGNPFRDWRAIAVAAACLALILSVFSWNPLARLASSEARDTAASTLVVYAGLRTLNAVLSAAQEVEVGASVGVSGSVQPLKTLEPVDDTVENVAAMVLAISVFAGVAGLGFGPLSVFGCGAVLIGLLLWTRAPPLAQRMVNSGMLLVLVLPAAFLASGIIGDAMTRSVWAENRAIQDRIWTQIDASAGVAEAPASEEADGLWDWLTGGLESASTIQRIATAAEVLTDEADDLLHSYVQILAVWLLKLVVLPLALMLLALRLIRAP